MEQGLIDLIINTAIPVVILGYWALSERNERREATKLLIEGQAKLVQLIVDGQSKIATLMERSQQFWENMALQSTSAQRFPMAQAARQQVDVTKPEK